MCGMPVDRKGEDTGCWLDPVVVARVLGIQEEDVKQHFRTAEETGGTKRASCEP